MIKPDVFFNKNIYFFFIVFFIGALIAFWPSYFSILDRQPDLYNHAHGISMTIWVLLLIIQPFLIKLNLRKLHRTIGSVSYVLVPIILISIFKLLIHNSGGMKVVDDFSLSFVALVTNAALAFAILFGLAIWYRKRSDIHARFMICTVFPMMTPVTDRLIAHHWRELIPMAPTIGGTPILPFFGFVFSDLLLLGLLIWDWRSNNRKDVFPVALLIVFLFQISVFSLYHFTWWEHFCLWLLN